MTYVVTLRFSIDTFDNCSLFRRFMIVSVHFFREETVSAKLKKRYGISSRKKFLAKLKDYTEMFSKIRSEVYLSKTRWKPEKSQICQLLEIVNKSLF